MCMGAGVGGRLGLVGLRFPLFWGGCMMLVTKKKKKVNR